MVMLIINRLVINRVVKNSQKTPVFLPSGSDINSKNTSYFFTFFLDKKSNKKVKGRIKKAKNGFAARSPAKLRFSNKNIYEQYTVPASEHT